jgi:Rps23 Pro-64 3,4-dihydroxylase Tpa1-like proline 4-hydroxylase
MASISYDISALHTDMGRRLDELTDQLETLGPRYQNAKPFPHIAIDDFLPPKVAEAALAQFPSESSEVWAKLPTEDQKRKLASTDEGRIPPIPRSVLFELNSGRFLRFLEKLAGVENLIADAKLVGGGLHQVMSGGKLSMHIDYSHHPQNNLFRRINLLVYLNKDWTEEYGGHLELWDAKLKERQVRILPVFNRCAIFSTSDISYHGHPEPLACPDHMSRKALSLYYFTKEPPEGKEHVVHNTLFRSRKGDPVHLSNLLVRTASSGLVRDLMPPIVYKTLRVIWNRRYTGK